MSQHNFFSKLRSLGYSLQESLAELVDNSITHNAKNIYIYMYWADDYGKKSFVMVVDDGDGMTQDELMNKALSVQDQRKDKGNHDLGLYGLGLKTGSFQYCKKITIFTKKNNFITKSLDCESGLFDNLPDCCEINLIQNQINKLKENKSGTIVVWSDLDRLISSRSRDSAINFYNEQDKARKHFRLIYSEFLSINKIKIFFSGSSKEKEVLPYDPFYRNNNDTKKLEDIKINLFNGGETILSAWIVPKDIGKENTNLTRNEMQGIYFYRRNRLISSGGWFGLGSEGKSEDWGMNDRYNRLRIKIELPDQHIKQWLSTSKNKIVIPEFAIKPFYKKISLLRKQYLDHLKLERQFTNDQKEKTSKIAINLDGLSAEKISDIKSYIDKIKNQK